MHSVL